MYIPKKMCAHVYILFSKMEPKHMGRIENVWAIPTQTANDGKPTRKILHDFGIIMFFFFMITSYPNATLISPYRFCWIFNYLRSLSFSHLSKISRGYIHCQRATWQLLWTWQPCVKMWSIICYVIMSRRVCSISRLAS